jgi:molybdate transport system substrate-binding protein
MAAAATAIATVSAGAACGGAHSSEHGNRTVTVFAAASLGNALQEVKSRFAKAHPEVDVRLNLGSSSTLATQVQAGAPADVFASADEPTMKKALDAGLADGQARIFARNTLSILVAKGNPKRITGLRDLSRRGLVVALCGPQVPVGRYGREALAKAGVPVPRGSQELDVKQVVSRVTLSEADAGIVYATDVTASRGKAEGVTIPANQNVEARYPVSALKAGNNVAGGRLFVDFLLSAEGQRALQAYGFLPPP